jgi:ABC-2 type transport system permease protein
MGLISQQTMLVPIVLFMVTIFAAQMVATAMAAEKENKTLETLLSSPISRTGLAVAKMVAAGIVALIGAAAYMVGFNFYMEGLMGQVPDSGSGLAEQLGLVLGLGDYVLLGISLFFAILVALAIALILGSFADSVRSVGAVIGPVIVLLAIPYFFVLFLDVSSLSMPLRVLVYAIPFSHAMMTAPNLFLGRYLPVVAGIAYQAVWFAVMAFVAARIFSSDKVLTMKLKWSRSRS